MRIDIGEPILLKMMFLKMTSFLNVRFFLFHLKEYRNLKLGGRIGIALSTDFALPYDEMLESDVIAAERANIFHIDWLLNPLITGDWPKVGFVKRGFYLFRSFHGI